MDGTDPGAIELAREAGQPVEESRLSDEDLRYSTPVRYDEPDLQAAPHAPARTVAPPPVRDH
jgi:hypothetical protein